MDYITINDYHIKTEAIDFWILDPISTSIEISFRGGRTIILSFPSMAVREAAVEELENN